MARDDERLVRSQQEPIVGGLPELPGDPDGPEPDARAWRPPAGPRRRAARQGLPGATISRAEREMLATAVSAANDCFYCMDSHGAFASALLSAAARTTCCRSSTTSSAGRRRG